MSEPIDVYWSFRSPYSYLVCEDLLALKAEFDVDLALRVVLPIAVREKATLFDPSNRKPVTYILMDCHRRAEFLGRPLVWPNPDPVAQSLETMEVAADQPRIFRLCKLGVEAQRRGKGLEFAANVSSLIFGGTVDWHEGDHLSDAAARAGLRLAEMDAAIAQSDHLEEIDRNHENLDRAGHWGVPTMVLRGEPFFGQDRVDTLRWRLSKLGVEKRATSKTL